MLGGVPDDGDHNDADEQLGEAEARQGRLHGPHEDLGLGRRQQRSRGEHHDGCPARQPRAVALAFQHRAEQVALRGERIDQTAGIRPDQNQRTPETETVDGRRLRAERAVEREVEHRGHHERDDAEKQHRRGVGGGGAMKRLRAAPQSADEEREAEHQEQIADDAAGD